MINLKKSGKTIIGMIHVGALPGTPMHRGHLSEIINNCLMEAKLYESCGVDAIMIENMHDVPYLNKNVGPEITASMAVIAAKIKANVKIPIGIQILAAANKEALAVAHAADLNFVRAEGYVYGHLADEGFMESCAGELLRYRDQIGAKHVAIITDVKKKHSSHSATSDVSLAETIKTSEYFLSDGIIITGTATGEQALVEDVKIAKEATKLPILLGSGVTEDNLFEYWGFADAFIVGSHFKENGHWINPVNQDRVIKFMKVVQTLRNNENSK